MSPPAIRLALFDFDGTLCRVNSWQVLLRRQLVRPTPAAVWLAGAIALRQVRLLRSETLKDVALAKFRGWSRAELNRFGADFYGECLRPVLFPAALAELERLRTAGFRVVVISGAFDFLLAPFCETHGVTDWECTRVAFDGERCAGRLGGAEMRGEAKVAWLERHFAGQTVDWAGSVAYSDELSDLPMLRRVGTGWLVGDRVPRTTGLPDGIQWGAW